MFVATLPHVIGGPWQHAKGEPERRCMNYKRDAANRRRRHFKGNGPETL